MLPNPHVRFRLVITATVAASQVLLSSTSQFSVASGLIKDTLPRSIETVWEVAFL